MGLNLNKKDAKTEEKVQATPVAEEKEVVETSSEAGAVDTELSSGRDDLAFIKSLGDPSNPDTTTIKNKETGLPESKKVTSTIVGYQFKALKDMKVPDFGIPQNLKTNLMDFADSTNYRDVKAGEVFNLTIFETGALLSERRFNGACTGGETPVSVIYQKKSSKAKSGDVVTVSASMKAPRIALRTATGSIKDHEIEDVLTFEDVVVGGMKRKRRTIKPGFEKWESLAKAEVRKASGRSKENRNVENEGAASFRAYMAAVSKRK